jgi:hypothetical protein
MNMTGLSRQLRLMLRGEILVIQAKLGFAMRRVTMLALALLLAGVGVVFVNIAVFAWLSPMWGPVWTPAGLGLINLALAGAALGLALALRPGPELALAEEIRAMAGESLEAEIRSTPLLGSLAGGGVGLDRSALAGLLVPAVGSIIGALGKRRKQAAKSD